jgi:hypothetical protein
VWEEHSEKKGTYHVCQKCHDAQVAQKTSETQSFETMLLACKPQNVVQIQDRPKEPQPAAIDNKQRIDPGPKRKARKAKAKGQEVSDLTSFSRIP